MKRGTVLALVTAGTFTDLLAYSIAIPVLPDLGTRLGASPAVIGLMFGSFGLTLLAVSIPMGMVSDRIGRKVPLVAGMATLAISTVVFAYARSIGWLFAARLVQGAADAVAWVVGFALIADLYAPSERGRAMGLVMAGTGFGLLIGPPLGGWLYEMGGIELPFLIVGALAAANGLALAWLPMPPRAPDHRIPMRALLRVRPIAGVIAAVAVASASIAMLEPVLPLFFVERLALRPSRIGVLFGTAAVASTMLHPVYGRLSDRFGGRRLMVAGLIASAVLFPLMPLITTPARAAFGLVMVWAALMLTVTPSLTFIAEAASHARLEAYGAVFGLYNVAWGIGLLAGPALGGLLYERFGFLALMLAWVPLLLAAAVVMVKTGSDPLCYVEGGRTMADKTPWRINGTWIEACNCDFGCPCNFDGFPTRGNCEGTVAFKVDSGHHGDTKLDGLSAAIAVKWPKAIHDGNGKAVAFIDERATEAQRQALIRILTAQDGGMPWEILATTLSELVGPHFVPITFDVKGTRSRLAVDGVDVQLEPFTNPVTGEEAEVHTVLPTGFIFRDGHVCKSAKNVASTGGLAFDWTGKNAYYAKIEWSNQ